MRHTPISPIDQQTCMIEQSTLIELNIYGYFSIPKDCSNGILIANGMCNDETNNDECNFDGGDCCGDCINTEHCSECVCYADGAPTLDMSCK